MPTRHRETVSGDLSESAEYQYRFSDSGPYNTFTSAQGSSDKKTIDDTWIPGFKALLKCGEFLPLNPVLIHRVRTQYTPGTVNASSRLRSDNSVQFEGSGSLFELYGSGISDSVGSQFSGRLVAPVPDSSDIDAAVIAAQANVTGADWDTLTFLAELKKTTHDLANVGTRFNNLTSKLAREAWEIHTLRKTNAGTFVLKKNLKRGIKRFLLTTDPWEIFRSLWLEARFMWRPMIGDAKDAVTALQQCLEKGQSMLRGRGRQTLSGSSAKTYETYLNANATEFVTEELEWDLTIRAMCYMRFDDIASSHFGFDAGVTAWELIPYSFVVDYFTNIGSWVSSLRPNIAGQFAGQCYSIKLEERYTVRSHVDWHDSPAQIVSGTHLTGCVGQLWTDSYQRLPYSGIPLPSLKPRLTLPKLVDIAALFIKGRLNVQRILSGLKKLR